VRVQVQVICTSEACMSGVFTVTLSTELPLKHWVKAVKYLECPAKVYSTIAGNVVESFWCQNCAISLLCAL